MADVKIEMTIGARTFVFGVPLLLSVIIWGTILFCSLRNAPPIVNVASPTVEAKFLTPPTNLVVKPSDVPVTINNPQQKLPDIIVNPAPERNVTFKLPDNKLGEPQIIEKIVEKIKEVPVYVDTKEDEYGKLLPNAKTISVDDMYNLAEKYLNSWFAKNGKDPKIENKRWIDMWMLRVNERGSEQNLANESMMEKRNGFVAEKAKTEEIVEICHLLLRFRDSQLAFPSVFKDYATAENLLKFKQFLEKGP